jgi:hypothetical protein
VSHAALPAYGYIRIASISYNKCIELKVATLLVLTESQAMVLSDVLTKILLRESYRVSDVEECLSWLQQPGDRAVSCPFERGFAQSLAVEILNAIRRSDQTP